VTDSIIDFASDAVVPVDPAKIADIINLARELVRRQKRVADLEKELKEAEQAVAMVAENSLPAMLQECNLPELSLGNGWKVVREPFFRANLPAPSTIEKAKPEEAEDLVKRLEDGIAWLSAEKGRDIIQDTITIKLKKGQNEQAKQLQDLIDSLKLKGERGSKVHPATLTKFLKEKIEAGVEVPFETFAVHSGFAAKVVPPEKPKPKGK
jgi:chemotaxis protein histidine kinase CheA